MRGGGGGGLNSSIIWRDESEQLDVRRLEIGSSLGTFYFDIHLGESWAAWKWVHSDGQTDC